MASRQSPLNGAAEKGEGGDHAHGLPHERDESPSDETTPENERNDELGQQAHDDARRGIQDTTSAPEIDEAYGKVSDKAED